jgi:DNA-binding CsgD family transcriptional regulator
MDPFTIATSQLEQLMHRLTPRQLQIVELLARGYSLVYIAAILSIGRETVKTHIRKMCQKLDVDNRIQIIVIYAMWKATNNGKQCDICPEARE